MRLAWILLAALAVAYAAPGDDSSSTTLEATSVSTTAAKVDEDATTTTAGGDVEPVNTASTTEGPTVPTDAPVTGLTDAATDKPEPTHEPNTGETKEPVKTTTKAVVTTKTTKAAGPTTTKEPQPDVESFSVKCDSKTSKCTYSMQVPGLDIDTYNKLIGETVETATDVNRFEATDLVNLQAGVTQVFAEADATADYVESQLTAITAELKALETQATELGNDISDVNANIYSANANLKKILGKKGSCLYRQCILKETTTTRPVTTTTVRTTPTPFCKQSANIGEDGKSLVCQNGGACNDWYDGYYCTCTGNLDGQDEDCATSACDVIRDSQLPGLILSPGLLSNFTNTEVTIIADDDCDQAQWTVTAENTKENVLTLMETSDEWAKKDSTFISKLSTAAYLQLTVGKYKLKITKTTKWTQINQILEYGPTATIVYNGPVEDYFHFTLTEKPKPTPTPTPAKPV